MQKYFLVFIQTFMYINVPSNWILSQIFTKVFYNIQYMFCIALIKYKKKIRIPKHIQHQRFWIRDCVDLDL